MPIFRSCLCWNDVRTGSVATAVLTMTLSFIQILLQIAIWTGNAHSTEDATHHAPYVVYIPLAALDFLIIIASLVLIVGLERDYKGRHLLLPWIAILIIYILYDIPVSIYFFAVTFPWAEDLNRGTVHYSEVVSPFLDGSNVLVELIVLVVFWCLKLVLYVIGILCVISRFQELSRYRKKPSHHLYDQEDHGRWYLDNERPIRDRIPTITVNNQQPPPRYPYDREERARADYKTPREPKRNDPYNPATPYPCTTPRIYPQHDFNTKGDERNYYTGRY